MRLYERMTRHITIIYIYPHTVYKPSVYEALRKYDKTYYYIYTLILINHLCVRLCGIINNTKAIHIHHDSNKGLKEFTTN